MPSPLSAVLLDSGGVLMRPIGGRWNPRADFEPALLRRNPALTTDQFAAAIKLGDQFMTSAESTPDLDRYHSVMLESLGVDPTPDLLAELIRPVPADVVLELFDDVAPTLKALRSRGIRMAVVSDAWPNLPHLHADLGIHEYFEAYAISAELGCRKPDPRMYHHASNALALDPGECLFVDDHADLVAAAIKLGYQGRWLRRDDDEADPVDVDVPVISSLSELLELC
jgi:HAD superfamily hydrolase (TIGR01509 family)